MIPKTMWTSKRRMRIHNLKKIAASVLSFPGTKSVWKSHKTCTAQIDKRTNRRRQDTLENIFNAEDANQVATSNASGNENVKTQGTLQSSLQQACRYPKSSPTIFSL